MPTQPTDFQAKQPKVKKIAPALTTERATDDVYNNGVWGQTAAQVEFDLTTPSGQRCRVKRMSVQDLVFNGSIDDLDAISKLVDQTHIAPRKGKGDKARTDTQQARDGLKLLADPNMKKAFAMVDKIVCDVVVAPAVHLRPENEPDTVDGAIYIDMIGIEDRFFIFSFVMQGMEGAAQFRPGSGEAVADIQPL